MLLYIWGIHKMPFLFALKSNHSEEVYCLRYIDFASNRFIKLHFRLLSLDWIYIRAQTNRIWWKFSILAYAKLLRDSLVLVVKARKRGGKSFCFINRIRLGEKRHWLYWNSSKKMMPSDAFAFNFYHSQSMKWELQFKKKMHLDKGCAIITHLNYWSICAFRDHASKAICLLLAFCFCVSPEHM